MAKIISLSHLGRLSQIQQGLTRPRKDRSWFCRINLKKRSKNQRVLWLMSFSDLSLVMLCFFILLVSMMEMKKRDFDHFKQGFEPDVVEEASHDSMFNKTAKQITEVIKKKIDKLAEVYSKPSGVYIEFKEKDTF